MYTFLLNLLGQSDSAIRAAFQVGSRVYGTAGALSDHDFLVVLAGAEVRRDLVFGEDANVIVHSAVSFQDALDDQSVFACEALFAPAPFRLKEPRPPLSFKLHARRLAENATARSRSDYEKAGRRFAEEPEASRKRLFHSIRVPMFAAQILRTGRMHAFDEANVHHAAILANESEEFEYYDVVFGPIRERLCEELWELAGRR